MFHRKCRLENDKFTARTSSLKNNEQVSGSDNGRR